jgi:hypothetical protein
MGRAFGAAHIFCAKFKEKRRSSWPIERNFVLLQSMKRKVATTFKVDAAMVPIFIGVCLTGIKTHVSFPSGPFQAWMTAHIYLSLLFLALALWHVWLHRGWYRALRIRNRKARRHPTLMLNAVSLFVAVTGLLHWGGISGSGWWIGHCHWIGGLVMTFFGVAHAVRRGNRLIKGLFAK